MKNIILALLLIIAFKSSAQECGTPITTTNQVFNIPTNNDAQYCVNIKFHIVRETNGTGGFNASQIPNLINYINQFYNSLSINVASAGFDYINNSALFNIDDVGNSSTEFNQLITNNNVSNAINFYIVNSAASYNGRAGNIISNNLVVKVDRVFTTTSPHEIGHCFNLLHTFQGTAAGTGGCSENINGSNCSSCGDNVCDTPADAGNGNTSGYTPDLTNIMSYYFTRDHFTEQQGTRMRNAIGGSSILQPTLGNICASLSGPDSICSTTNYLFNFSSPQLTPVLWSVTSNLQIINSSNSSITVKALNIGTYGMGTITAINNGIQITKSFWIGVSALPQLLTYSNIPYNSSLQNGPYFNPTWIFNTKSTFDNVQQFTVKDELGNPIITKGADNNGRAEFSANELGIGYGGTKNFLVYTSNYCGINNPSKKVLVKFTIYYPTLCQYGFGCPMQRTTSLSNDKIFSIFPNPATNIFKITLNSYNGDITNNSKASATIFDMIGQPKSSVLITNNETTMSVIDLYKGIYILKIKIGDEIENHQIIID